MMTRWIASGTGTFATLLIVGCSPLPPPPTQTEALFCDIEEQRVFTQRELDWRSANAPENLRLDFKTNLAWEREECEGPS